jgi:hypothetical protein
LSGAFEGVGRLDDAGLIEEVADDLQADGEGFAAAAGDEEAGQAGDG